jgi:alkyl hydroperoxide reductase subunit AhpF
MIDEDFKLDTLLKAYRDACPDTEPAANFMPVLWQKIEARRSFWFAFQREARAVMTASAALFVVLLVLNLFSGSQSHLTASTYADALMAEHTAEKTYYTEAIRSTPGPSEVSGLSPQ